MITPDHLARCMREDHRTAREDRVAARLVAERRWRRLAAFAGRRASRAARGR